MVVENQIRLIKDPEAYSYMNCSIYYLSSRSDI